MSAKKFYKSHNIPTASFEEFETLDQVKEAVIKGELSFPLYGNRLKWAMMAMEFPLFTPTRKSKDWTAVPALLRNWFPLKRIICDRFSRPQGEIVHYPVVESEFHPTANQVEYVLCPARISGEVAKKAVEVALNTAKAFGQIGILAVELFWPLRGMSWSMKCSSPSQQRTLQYWGFLHLSIRTTHSRGLWFAFGKNSQ